MPNINQGNAGAGIFGIVDLPGVGAKFSCKIYRWSPRLKGGTRARRGRGGGVFRTIRWVFSSGSIALTGSVTPIGVPAPDAWKGQTGTVTVQVMVGKTVAYPIIVTEHGFDFDSKKNTLPYIVISGEVTGAPAYTGWGTQPAATDPSKSDQQQWEGTSFTKDPNVLQGASQVTIDWWGTVTDSDAGDIAKLDTVIAAAIAPYVGMKLRTATMARDATDGGTIVTTWGLTDTKDDEEMPSTLYDVDNQVIFGQVDVAKIQDTATISWPTTPSEPAYLKYGTVSKVQRNDGKWKLIYHFVRNDTKDAIELPKTHTVTDPNDLGETATIALVTNSSTPPSPPAAPVGELVYSDTQPLTKTNSSYTGYWVHTFEYGPANKLHAMEMQGDLIVDPSQINDADTIHRISDTSTPLTTPDPGTADLKLVRRTTTRIQYIPEKWEHTFQFARNTAKDELELKKRNADPDDFAETERLPVLHTSRTSTPGTPTQIGTTSNLVDTQIEDLCVPNGSFTGLFLWTFVFGPSTRKQSIEQEGEISRDVGLLGGKDVQTITSSSSTLPGDPATRIASMVVIARTSIKFQDTPQKWKHIYIFGYADSQAKLIAERTRTSVDPSGLASVAFTAAIDTSAAAGAPTLSGYELYDAATQQLPDNPTLYLHVYEFRLINRQHEIEYKEGPASFDPLEGGDYLTATVQSWTSTSQALAESIHGANKTDTLYRGVQRAVRLNSNKAMYLLRKASSNKKLIPAGGGSRWVSLSGVPNTLFPQSLAYNPATDPWGDPNLLVKTSFIAPYTIPNTTITFYSARLRPITIQRIEARYIIRRWYSTSAVQTYLYRSLWGKVNTAALHGFPAHTILFEYSAPRYDLVDTDAHLMAVDHVIKYDDYYHFSDGNGELGRVFCSVAGITTSGFARYLIAASYFHATMVALWPAAGDLSVLS